MATREEDHEEFNEHLVEKLLEVQEPAKRGFTIWLDDEGKRQWRAIAPERRRGF